MPLQCYELSYCFLKTLKKMVASAGDCRGDSRGDALGARAGKGPPRSPSPSSPLPPAGSRFWALSPSDDDSDVDELASVEAAAQHAVSGGVAGRAPVTLGPFIDRALGSPGWTRAGRGRHGRSRVAGAGPVAAAPPSSSSDPDPGSDPGGSLDPAGFPPLPSLPLSGAAAVGSGRSPVLQVGEFVFPARSPARTAVLGFSGAPAAAVSSGSGPPCPLGPRCRCRLGLRPFRSGSRPRWALRLLGLLGPRPVFLARVFCGPSVPLLSGSGDQREP
jgi:hypothetical protein